MSNIKTKKQVMLNKLPEDFIRIKELFEKEPIPAKKAAVLSFRREFTNIL